MFDISKVTTGETSSCFYPLKGIVNRKSFPLRACPLASLLLGFSEVFDETDHQKGGECVMNWHQARGSQFLGNILDIAPTLGRWIWKTSSGS